MKRQGSGFGFCGPRWRLDGDFGFGGTVVESLLAGSIRLGARRESGFSKSSGKNREEEIRKEESRPEDKVRG